MFDGHLVAPFHFPRSLREYQHVVALGEYLYRIVEGGHHVPQVVLFDGYRIERVQRPCDRPGQQAGDAHLRLRREQRDAVDETSVHLFGCHLPVHHLAVYPWPEIGGKVYHRGYGAVDDAVVADEDRREVFHLHVLLAGDFEVEEGPHEEGQYLHAEFHSFLLHEVAAEVLFRRGVVVGSLCIVQQFLPAAFVQRLPEREKYADQHEQDG